MVKKGEIPSLINLVKNLEEARLRLEEAYQEKNPAKFEREKKFILQIQRKISEELR